MLLMKATATIAGSGLILAGLSIVPLPNAFTRMWLCWASSKRGLECPACRRSARIAVSRGRYTEQMHNIHGRSPAEYLALWIFAQIETRKRHFAQEGTGRRSVPFRYGAADLSGYRLADGRGRKYSEVA